MVKGQKNKRMAYYYQVLLFLQLLTLINVTATAQLKQSIAGKYFYESYRFSETLILEENGRFKYKCSSEFLKEEIQGNWQFRENFIVLDSYPQHDKIIVYEGFRRNLKGIEVSVLDKSKYPINYNIIAYLRNGDSVLLNNQWKKTQLNYKLNSFKIVDSKGLASPRYEISSNRANSFYCLFETRKIFENESWEIKNKGIIPRNGSDIPQNYVLQKVE